MLNSSFVLSSYNHATCSLQSLIMCKIEDVLYMAYYEGIKDDVLVESSKLNKQARYKHLEVGDRLEIAYNNIKAKKQQK